MQHINSARTARRAAVAIRELIDAHVEWLYAREDGGATTTIRRNDFEFRVERGRLVFSCWNDTGAQAWFIDAWEWTGEFLAMDALRRAGRVRARLELIPRKSVRDAMALISEARRARCHALAELARAMWPGAKTLRVSLSSGARRGQPGRDARILVSHRNAIFAITGPLAEDEREDVDFFLSSVLLWFGRVSNRTRPPFVKRLCLVASAKQSRALAERITLLRDELQSLITIYEIDPDRTTLTLSPKIDRSELWIKRPARLKPPSSIENSAAIAAIVAMAPNAIDVVRARQGATLRFHGLAFARVRRLMGRESIWFGIDWERRQPLNDETRPEFIALIEELKEHRCASPPDRRHALYRAVPEAWLESILRRDITRLDPGLIIAPLHAQFRTSHATAGGQRPVDLLALRTDGRLVVIELKVSEAREHVLQGVDYWRRVEAHRRAGNIVRARLFDDAFIEDAPPLVYLAAPTLHFHRAFEKLARTIAPDIALYRFDLNEDWRAGVRVMRRMAATH